MRCMNEEQIERMASSAEAPNPKLKFHLEGCSRCRERIAQARRDAMLVADILELSRTRDAVRPLADTLEPRLPD